MYRYISFAAALICSMVVMVIALPASGGDIGGNWCRNVNNVLADVITITPKGEVFNIHLREGWDRSVYSEGIGSLNENRFTATLRSKTSPVIVHSIMAISGDSLIYTSFNMDGSFRWKGTYFRCKQ